jgi:hypothetical protein
VQVDRRGERGDLGGGEPDEQGGKGFRHRGEAIYLLVGRQLVTGRTGTLTYIGILHRPGPSGR